MCLLEWPLRGWSFGRHMRSHGQLMQRYRQRVVSANMAAWAHLLRAGQDETAAQQDGAAAHPVHRGHLQLRALFRSIQLLQEHAHEALVRGHDHMQGHASSAGSAADHALALHDLAMRECSLS